MKRRRRRIRTARLATHERPCECPLCASVQHLVVDMVYRVIATITPQHILDLIAKTESPEVLSDALRDIQAEVPASIRRAVQRERRRRARWEREAKGALAKRPAKRPAKRSRRSPR